MPKDRACANTPALPRRLFLASLPLASVVLTSPTSGSASEPSQILRLFRHWEDLERSAEEVSEQECDRITQRMTELADAMCALPSRSAADFAAKVTAYTIWGGLGLPQPPHPIWQDARRLLL